MTDTPSQWLAQESQEVEKDWPLEDMVLTQYQDFRDIFSKEAFDELPPQKAWDHAIDLTPRADTSEDFYLLHHFIMQGETVTMGPPMAYPIPSSSVGQFLLIDYLIIYIVICDQGKRVN